MDADQIGELPYAVCGYCATCGKRFGAAKKGSLGRRIACPRGASHLAQVISADRPAEWWLRRERSLLTWQTKHSPFAQLRSLHRKLYQKLCGHAPEKEVQAGHFLTASFSLLVVALVLECRFVPCWARWAGRLTLGLLLLWRFVDIFLSNTSITFTSRFPANPLRSVVFSLAAFLQIVLSYAYFFSVLRSFGAIVPKGDQQVSVAEAVFFSFGTIATVGYGNLEPGNPLGQAVVASELVLGLYFVVIILAQVAAWTNQSKVELGRLPWDELREK